MGNNSTIPIIRLELSGFKHSLMAAIGEHHAQIDADLKAAVEEFCKPEVVGRIVREQALEILKAETEKEVERYFKYWKILIV